MGNKQFQSVNLSIYNMKNEMLIPNTEKLASTEQCYHIIVKESYKRPEWLLKEYPPNGLLMGLGVCSFQLAYKTKKVQPKLIGCCSPKSTLTNFRLLDCDNSSHNHPWAYWCEHTNGNP